MACGVRILCTAHCGTGTAVFVQRGARRGLFSLRPAAEFAGPGCYHRHRPGSRELGWGEGSVRVVLVRAGRACAQAASASYAYASYRAGSIYCQGRKRFLCQLPL
jgi:hypothetical protein